MILQKTIAIAMLALFSSTNLACNEGEPNTTKSENVTTDPVESAQSNVIKLKFQQISTELSSPVALEVPPGDNTKLFVVEQRGFIRIVQNGRQLTIPFLDVQNKMVSLSGIYDERGLLGMAFHPQYAQNKNFYVYYSAPSTVRGSNHKTVVSEFKTSAANPNIADPASERIILTFEQPKPNHNGGQLAFGPDGYLYIASGDGGGAGDQFGTIGNGQDLNTLLGKILRIDVNKGSTYSVPADNPFVGKAGAKPEIWAYGLRNPWRFSFDKPTGRLFCADVGQDKWEEVNIIKKGGNYGWRIMEASHCFEPNCKTDGLEMPIFEYDHKVGISITGGYVYRGNAINELKGKYVFADWTGPLFYLNEEKGKFTGGKLLIENMPKDIRILSFGEDSFGEIYVLTSQDVNPKSPRGGLYKLVKN